MAQSHNHSGSSSQVNPWLSVEHPYLSIVHELSRFSTELLQHLSLLGLIDR